jgi:hypothetical protein
VTIVQNARSIARVGGALYLLIIAIGALGEAVVRGSIVVPGDLAATAANLRSMEFLWRLGVAGEAVLLCSAVAVAVILYVLLRPAGRELALAGLLFNLVSIAIEGVAALSLASALVPLSSASYLTAFTPEQAGALAMLAIRSHTTGFGIALIFFGVECVILGILIYRSGYLPKWIGILMAIAGVCYVTNSFAHLLSPPLAARVFPAILLPALVAELSLALWLLLKGVHAGKWSEAAQRTEPAGA